MCTTGSVAGRPLWFTDHDESTKDLSVQCVQLSELEHTVKLGYYLYKAFRWTRSLPWPVP